MTAGLASAFAAVLLYAAANVLQAVGARRASGSASAQVGFPGLLRQPSWLVGVGLLLLAFMSFVVSTRVLPLPLAEAIRSAYLVVTVALGHAIFRTRPTSVEVVGALVAVGGITLFVAPGWVRGVPTTEIPTPALMAVALGVVLVVSTVLARRPVTRARRRGLVEAALAGLAFAVLDVGVRSLPDPLTAAFACTACWVGAVAAPVGLLQFARATARVDVGLATVVMTVVNVTAASAAASLLFGDSSTVGAVTTAAAAAAMAGGLMLMFLSSREPSELPQEAT